MEVEPLADSSEPAANGRSCQRPGSSPLAAPPKAAQPV